MLIDEIAECYFDKKKQREDDFSAFCEELKSPYHTTINSLSKKYVVPFLEQYSFLVYPSYLQIVLHRERKETDHSRFLEYILSQSKIGSSVILDFCNVIGYKSEWLKTIKQNLYTVRYEFSTKKQRRQSISMRRMDLLIKDDKNKWLIVIENKIDSKIRTKKGNQLDVYSEFCKREYSKYSKLYILLSYREDNFRDTENREWYPLNYYSVFNVLLKHAAEDPFIKEYLRTLYFLLFPDIRISNEHRFFSLYECCLFINRVISKLNQYAGNFIA